MLIDNPPRALPCFIVMFVLLAIGCEDKTANEKVNTPATHAKRSRELEERLAKIKQNDFKPNGAARPTLDSLRAERDRKFKEAELRQEKLQIANLSFAAEHPPEGVSVQGLSSPESWGSWSIGDNVTLRFEKPLPNRFKLQVLARAYGPNADEPITLVLGTQKESMKFKTYDSSQSLEVNLQRPIDTITFSVPKPTSPAEMNESADVRKLGIGLVKVLILRITP